MEIKIKTFLLIALIAGIMMLKTGCESNVENERNVLNKTWTHSYEEDVADRLIYRPIDYAQLAPSRYRQVIQLNRNTICNYSVLAPNDAHYMEQGKWTYSESDKKLQLRNATNELKFDFIVVRLESDLLVLSNKNP